MWSGYENQNLNPPPGFKVKFPKKLNQFELVMLSTPSIRHGAPFAMSSSLTSFIDHCISSSDKFSVMVILGRIVSLCTWCALSGALGGSMRGSWSRNVVDEGIVVLQGPEWPNTSILYFRFSPNMVSQLLTAMYHVVFWNNRWIFLQMLLNVWRVVESKKPFSRFLDIWIDWFRGSPKNRNKTFHWT